MMEIKVIFFMLLLWLSLADSYKVASFRDILESRNKIQESNDIFLESRSSVKQRKNECGTNSCQNGGTCIDQDNSHYCACLPEYTGRNCELDSSECYNRPCQNGATCYMYVKDYFRIYSCMCAPGYTGANCQIDINECEPDPCQNGTTCTDLVNSYSCACLPGYRGTNCEIENKCETNSCQNGGTCIEMVYGYYCACLPGYTGRNCELDYTECNSHPCQNGATCNVDPVYYYSMYSCTCAPGYTGTNCQIDINECEPDPCQNGATCTDLVNSCSCTCLPGYIGTNCEIVDETESETEEEESGYSHCWDNAHEGMYYGTISVTTSGRQCQNWADQSPHSHNYTKNAMFPFDGTVAGATNYCRDPDSNFLPWCYTMDPNKRWEICDIPICPSHPKTVYAQMELYRQNTVSQGNMVYFTHTIANIGNAYNTATGKFTAPYDGTYLFSVNLCRSTTVWTHFSIKQGGNILSTGRVGDPEWGECGNSTAVTYMTSGSQVWVEIGEILDEIPVTIQVRHSFTGVLLNDCKKP